MKSLIGTLILFIGLPASLMAQPYQNNCELYYWEMNKPGEEQKMTQDQYLRAGCTLDSTRLIRRAERYKKASRDREAEIDNMVQERIAAAKGERSGKVIRTFREADFGNIASNPLNIPVAARVVIFEGNDVDEYETGKDHLCKQFGYEKGLDFTLGKTISDGRMKDRELLSDRIIEFREARFLKNAREIIHEPSNRSKGYGMEYQLYESVTCEKTRLANEPVQDFEIDVESIRRILQEEVRAPRVDDEVERILSLNRPTPSRIKNELGENHEEPKNENEYRPTTWEEEDNEWVYKSTNR